MIPETTSIPCRLIARTASRIGHDHILPLVHGRQRLGLRRLDAAENRVERRLTHESEDLGRAGNVECRFARQADCVAVALLPFDQMRQEIAQGTPVGDKIVIDKIDGAVDAAGQQLVEFANDLSRSLESRNPAIKSRNIAKLASVRTAARKLDAAEKIPRNIGKLIGGRWEIAEVAAGLLFSARFVRAAVPRRGRGYR